MSASAIDHANLLAGQAVAYAEAYLEGRSDARVLKANAEKLQLELMALSDPSAHALLDATRILDIALLRLAAHALALQAATTRGGDHRPLIENVGIIAERGARWRAVTESLVGFVRAESLLLASRAPWRDKDNQRRRLQAELEELAARQALAIGVRGGGTLEHDPKVVAARSERISAIKAELARLNAECDLLADTAARDHTMSNEEAARLAQLWDAGSPAGGEAR